MANALNVKLDSIWKAKFASLVLDCVSSVVMPIFAPSVILMHQNLIKKINANVKPAIILIKNRKTVLLALK
jgi:hypothetical protein